MFYFIIRILKKGVKHEKHDRSHKVAEITY